MEIDVGLDAGRLSYDDHTALAAEAARCGYTRFWTTGGADPFQVCALRWAASRQVTPGGIGTAIGVLPVGVHTPASLAMSAAQLSQLSGGRFILGLGSGSSYQADYRRTWGIEERSSLLLMRAYLSAVRGLLAGERVTCDGSGFHYEQAGLSSEPARTPVYLGALGPAMLRLGGELADGISLSWCTAPRVAWSRDRILEGARTAGRDPAIVKLATYVRVCVDDDVDVARRALARALVNYALGWPGVSGRQVYRTHFECMGFAADVKELAAMRERGAPEAEVVDAFPERLLRQVGYYGPAAGAAAAFLEQAQGADVAIVRVVPARLGIDSMLAVMRACRSAVSAVA